MGSQSSPSVKPRVCAVSYLNTVPLVWGMLHGRQRGLFDLSFCVPSECADRVLSGAADIGIIPAVELRQRALDVIRGPGIACRGPVRSILLFGKKPFAEIHSLAADSSSRTSVALARIVLAERYGAVPRIVSMAPDLPAMLQAAEAALIIGDPALHLDPSRLPYRSLDLGEEWAEMTGLPMVFAVWAGRTALLSAEAKAAFGDSCRFGLAHLDDIVAGEARPRRLPEELARQYLTRHIVFELGEREHQGLDLFLQYAAKLDRLIPTGTVSA